MNDCLLCEGSLSLFYSGISSSYDRANTYSIGLCTKCKLYQTVPRPSNSVLNEIYSKVYAYDLHEAIHPEKSFRARKLANMFGIPDANSIVVEIGCGEGILLKYLQSRGVAVFGCELDKKSADKANLTLGDKRVFNMTVESFLQEVRVKADYIYISHTLEHFENPLIIMKSLHAICGPNTKIVIAVPNISNVKRWFFPRKWGYWQVPVHITHFSKHSLNFLLREAGFQSKEWVYRNSDILTIGNFWFNLFNLGSGISKVNQPLISLLTLFSRIHSYTYLFGRNDLIVLCEPE